MVLIGKRLRSVEEMEIMQFVIKCQLNPLSCILAIVYFLKECHKTEPGRSGPPLEPQRGTNGASTHKRLCGQMRSLLLCFCFCA